MSNRQLNIGLFGFGVVGEGIYRLLEQTPALCAQVKKVCILHPEKSRNAPAELFTTRANELLEDESINVIVELIDDADAAWLIVSKALSAGKAVVSANKKMIASHFDELRSLQKKFDVPFLYEAAVCGSVPVIRNLEEYFDNDLLQSFSGIVNGSTNFILTQIRENDWTYPQALAEAQRLGFAETDPSLDVEGIDATNKLSIILYHAFGVSVEPAQLPRLGITGLSPFDTEYAAEKGLGVKLVAQAVRIAEGEVAAWVLPTFIPESNRLFDVRNEFNGVIIGSSFADEQFFCGKGAGRYPSASAVLSDISALRYDYRYEYRKSKGLFAPAFSPHVPVCVYVSHPSGSEPGKAFFTSIEESYRGRSRSYFTGTIFLDDLSRTGWSHNPEISVILIGIAEPETIPRYEGKYALEAVG